MDDDIRRDDPADDQSAARDSVSPDGGEPALSWEEVSVRFLEAVEPGQWEAVEPLLEQLHYGSTGLRSWIDAIVDQGAVLPQKIPAAVIDAYLHDPEATPLYECEECGLTVPVRPNRTLGPDAEPEKVYFPECPACGGQTGYYLYRTRGFTEKLRRARPR